jgi:polyvinyl alcohol dehydrogenase (cytochrome)
VTSTFRPLILAAFAVLASLATSAIAAPPAAQPTPVEGAAMAEHGNGTMGMFAGADGDAKAGEALYQQKCASCHDHPSERIPAKATIAGNTPTMIMATLLEGVMRPLAAGMTPHDMASVAAYLSTRKDGGLGAGALEAPACKDQPGPLDFAATSQWNGWGRTETQSRYQPRPGIAAADVPKLKLKWAFAYSGSRNGQATVIGDRLFINSASGAVYALNARTGCAYWRFDIPGGSRASIVVGKLPGKGPARYAAYTTGWTERTAYALDVQTGKLIWKTLVDDQQEVQMTGSPVLHEGRLYVPVSSAEEAIADDPSHECCKFRGAVAAVDAATGKIVWKTYVTTPAKPFKKNAKGGQMFGPAGGAIWGAPTLDAKRGVLYVATGDSYTDVEFPTSDAVLAMDLKTGAIRWTNQLAEHDNYIVGCGPKTGPVNCPSPAGPDYDFGASPILHTLASGKQVLLAGQKSSQVYGLDPDAEGKLIWQQRLSQGGPLGGVEFGMATDGKTLYAPISDIFVPGKPSRGVFAFNIADGKPKWSAPSPVVTCSWKNVFCSGAVSQAISAMPGAVFAGSMDGRFRALDPATGKILWDFDTTAKVMSVTGKEAMGGVMDGAGPTIAGGVVYVSSGYQGRSGQPGIVLMAFSVDGK